MLGWPMHGAKEPSNPGITAKNLLPPGRGRCSVTGRLWPPHGRDGETGPATRAWRKTGDHRTPNAAINSGDFVIPSGRRRIRQGQDEAVPQGPSASRQGHPGSVPKRKPLPLLEGRERGIGSAPAVEAGITAS